jgi:hypothetical protein
MRKLIIVLGIGLTVWMLQVNALSAQNITVNVNIDRQPAWGPAGYNYAAFYYFPSINVYYDVNGELFYYPYRSRWVSSYYLPSKYYKYDFYTLYKVVLNDHPQPWIYNRSHKLSYAHYKRIRTQAAIHRTNDIRYQKAKTNNRAWTEARKPKETRQSTTRASNRRSEPSKAAAPVEKTGRTRTTRTSGGRK